jgi:FkbM family methyltransferase
MQTPPSTITSELKCDAAGTKRQTLLDLWSAARSQMPEPLLLKVLDLAKENTDQALLGRDYHLWAPDNDDGLSYMLSTLNEENSVDHGGLHELHENLGVGKLFVDVGSCLGMMNLAVTHLYPGTKIVSLEPASPNWLLQELNLRCNLEHNDLLNIHVVLAGVGPNTPEEDNMMAKLMWRPTATTSTRAWTPATEGGIDNVELVVRLRRLKSILAEANVYGVPIDVLNVDCEGCEYNLLPALTEEEFDAIPTVMGGLHWGYIPLNKLPSSERGRTTHERLCQHENIARTAKECCAFPNLPVKSSVPGEILVREKDNKSITVADVAGDLCVDFENWALDHYLNDVPNDWGWMELTSQA